MDASQPSRDLSRYQSADDRFQRQALLPRDGAQTATDSFWPASFGLNAGRRCDIRALEAVVHTVCAHFRELRNYAPMYKIFFKDNILMERCATKRRSKFCDLHAEGVQCCNINHFAVSNVAGRNLSCQSVAHMIINKDQIDALEFTMTNQKETWNSPVLETLDVTRTMSGNFTLLPEGVPSGLTFGTTPVVGLGS